MLAWSLDIPLAITMSMLKGSETAGTTPDLESRVQG